MSSLVDGETVKAGIIKLIAPLIISTVSENQSFNPYNIFLP